MAEWRNWSGSVRASPSRIARPRDEAELSALVAGAERVRVAGAGHSFTPLCETDGLLLSLADMASEIEVCADRTSVWAPAGLSLSRLTAALWAQGLSLANQGDVNPQALAGAIATGTHGTGAALGSLSTFARAFRLVLADGSAVEVSRAIEPELFEAQRLSLGLLGVASRIQIDVVPAYRLEERIEARPLAEVVETFDHLAATHRHAEFWVFPYADQVILKTLHPTDDPAPPKAPSPVDEVVFRLTCQATRGFPGLAPALQRLLMRLVTPSRRTGPAHEIFPSDRSVRFEEMEYEVPRPMGLAALREAIDWIRRTKAPVAFPFEFRLTAADDIWLSPFHAGPCASISMHQYAPMPWPAVFAGPEAIFRAAGGRPHWAKRHSLTREDVDALYPAADRFRQVRKAVDPEAKFLNAHLAPLFG